MSMEDRLAQAEANLRQTRGASAALGIQPGPGLDLQRKKKKTTGQEERIGEEGASGGEVERVQEEGGQGVSGERQREAQEDQREHNQDSLESDDESWRPGGDRGRDREAESEEDQISVEEGGSLDSVQLGRGNAATEENGVTYQRSQPNTNPPEARKQCPIQRQDYRREAVPARRRSPSREDLIQENLTEVSTDTVDSAPPLPGKRRRSSRRATTSSDRPSSTTYPRSSAYETAKRSKEGWLPDAEYKEKKAAERRSRMKRDGERNERRYGKSPDRPSDRRDDWQERRTSPSRGYNRGFNAKRNDYRKRS
ncbi:uncharacterized protein MELLADRAFT_104156 [Melampsora larici-populina 98AG31]|uniref:Uncharacterized protein n=1 Tax=Melampsora larici-populina (strain 98AG31 / pathotype 3-4-7) TaxID=747676 RepID=F4RDR9_MELLP|nr:uncharacterized protein MELLADRAFT_104156 [Melampsora larici-populina 98AG31]EGG09448.1 hypothetical protein MELLADRAFT_104156 [Melampsora larici-populina 98AG31]